MARSAACNLLGDDEEHNVHGGDAGKEGKVEEEQGSGDHPVDVCGRTSAMSHAGGRGDAHRA